MAEWISGNIFIRPILLDKPGSKMDGHGHNFDHTTIVFSGPIRVVARKAPTLMSPADPVAGTEDLYAPGELIADRMFGEGTQNGNHFLVKAGVHHEIISMVPTAAEVKASLAGMSKAELIAMLVSIKTAPAKLWCAYSHRQPQSDEAVTNTGWEISPVNTGHSEAYQ